MTLFLFYFLIFIFGLCAGSFLNAVIYRLEKGESIIAEPRGTYPPQILQSKIWAGRRGTTRKINSSETKFLFKKLSFFWGAKMARSYCPYCQTILRWYDLVPVLSFFALKGRCRYCGEKISWQYPSVEIATGIIFLLIFNFAGAGTELVPFRILNQFLIFNFQISNLISFLYFLSISSVLIIIFTYDFKYYLIPDKVVFPGIGIALVYRFWEFLNHSVIQNSFKIQNSLSLARNLFQFEILLLPILAAVLASGFFFLLVALSKGRWMGLGDVKLAVLMGLILGWPNILVALFLAFMSGAVVGVALILLSAGSWTSCGSPTSQNSTPSNWSFSLKSQIPFGPFLILGTFAALFWGQRIIEWYLGMWF